MKRNLSIEYHSCYDQLLAKLLMLTFEDKEKDISKEAVQKDSNCSVSLISNEVKLTGRVGKGNKTQLMSFKYEDDLRKCGYDYYDNSYDMTAHEIIIYSLLLHKCIEIQSEEATISFSELQKLRNKRIGKNELLDNDTRKAYNDAFKGLCKKRVRYSINPKKRSKKITFNEGEHPLLIVRNVKKLENGDKIIQYSLGKFGKTILESKQYSTLVPAKYFKINFNEVMTYQIALYVCRIIYIQKQPRKKKSEFTLKLTSIMKNTSKFIKTKENEIIRTCCSLYYYDGENTKRYWEHTIKKVNELLDILKSEYKIKDYKFIYQLENTYYGTKYDYQNVKWVIQT